MSLRVWLPLNGDLQNRGLDGDLQISFTGTLTFANNGKIGKKCYQRATSSTQMTTGVNINSNLLNLLGIKASVAMWVKPLGTHTHYNGTLLSSGNWNAKRWTFGVSQDNTKVDVLCGGYNTYINCEVPVNEWTHLCSTFDNGVSKLYKNGIYIGQLTDRAAFDSDAINTYIGRETYANGYFGFNGLINDVRIYDHVLSLKQIKEISKGLILHYKLDDKYTESTVNLCNGLVKGGHTVVVGDTITNTGENADTYWYIKPKEALVGGATYTVSCQLQGFSSNSDYISWGVCAQSGTNYAGSWKTYNGYNEFTFVMPAGLDGSTANIIFDDNGGSGVKTQIFTISKIQLEKKDHATPYAGIGGVRNETIVYDSSGYQNNGTIVGNIQSINNSPRYAAAAKFDGASAIKVTDNNWVSQGMRQMTINLWIKPTTSFSKFFSCTESGGWNTQFGKSGYIRFPIHVYTNQAQTSTAYKYDSMQLKISDIPVNKWSMLTFIYNENGTRTYINGILHHTYSNISYGIHYNFNARLFLGCQASTATATSPYFTGQQSDFQIYATALSEEDIKELYRTSTFIDRKQNFYSKIYCENNINNEIEYLYDLYKVSGSGTFSQDQNGLYLNQNIRVSHHTIPIDPTNKIYKYDIIYSNDSGNNFYIGWERYDAQKTARSNDATVYVVASSAEANYKRITGIVNLSTDGVNPCAFIKLRILNKWTGSASDTNGTAIIHSLSLKQFEDGKEITPFKISQQGIVNTTSILEKDIGVSINKSFDLNSNNFYEI